MTRQEKLELKSAINSFIGALFDSQQRELRAAYPFLNINDNDIEDDDIDLPEPEKKPPSVMDLAFAGINEFTETNRRRLTQISEELYGDRYTIQSLGDSARGVERGRGIILRENMSGNGTNIRFYFRSFIGGDGRRRIAIVGADEKGGDYMKSIGYSRLNEINIQMAENGELDFYKETMPEFYEQIMKRARAELIGSTGAIASAPVDAADQPF